MRSRLVRSLLIVALLIATVSAGGASADLAAQAARPMSTAEMAGIVGGRLSNGECFLLGLGLGIACTMSGGMGCAAAILLSAGTGGLDCLG